MVWPDLQRVYKMEDGGWVPGLLAGASNGKHILGLLSALHCPRVPIGALADHPATLTVSMESALQGEHWRVTVVRAVATRAEIISSAVSQTPQQGLRCSVDSGSVSSQS